MDESQETRGAGDAPDRSFLGDTPEAIRRDMAALLSSAAAFMAHVYPGPQGLDKAYAAAARDLVASMDGSVPFNQHVVNLVKTLAPLLAVMDRVGVATDGAQDVVDRLSSLLGSEVQTVWMPPDGNAN